MHWKQDQMEPPVRLNGWKYRSSTTAEKITPIFFLEAQQLNLGLGRLTVVVSRSHTATYTHIHTHNYTHTHTHTHTRQDSSERVISLSQRPLPTQHTANTKRRTSMMSVEFEPTIAAIKQPQNYVLNRRITVISLIPIIRVFIS